LFLNLQVVRVKFGLTNRFLSNLLIISSANFSYAWLPADCGAYSYIDNPLDGASDSLTFLGIIVSNTLSSKNFLISFVTSLLKFVLLSNIVKTTAPISKL